MCLNKFIEDEKIKGGIKGGMKNIRKSGNNCLCETEGTVARNCS